MGSFVLTAGHQRRRKRAHIPGCSGFTAGRLHKSSLLRASPFHLSMCRCMCGLCGCTHVCVHEEVRGQLQASLLWLCLPVCCCCLASGSLPSLDPPHGLSCLSTKSQGSSSICCPGHHTRLFHPCLLNTGSGDGSRVSMLAGQALCQPSYFISPQVLKKTLSVLLQCNFPLICIFPNTEYVPLP